MGSFDCFCAVCGGSLGRPQIGSMNARALARRDRRVARKRSKMENRDGWEGGIGDADSESDFDDEDDDDDDDDDDTEESDNDSNAEGTEDADDDWRPDGEEVEEDWYPEDEDQSYDPRIVSEQTLEWLGDVRCLGFNPNANGENRAFITGPASYSNHGAIEVARGDDPNQPDTQEFDCYEACDSDRMAVFPFHSACHDVLARVICHGQEKSKIDNDVLYDAMARLGWKHGTRLDLDYGNITGIDQFWEPVPGEEFSVFNPLNIKDFSELVSRQMSSGTFQTGEKTQVSGPLNQENDCFSRLTPQILLLILKYLSASDALAFSQVSRPAYHATNNNEFWKRLVLGATPWLWDQDGILREGALSSTDCKKLCAWLNSVSTPKYGVGAPFLAIANRRRIWDVCVQISSRYHELKGQSTNDQPNQVLVETSHCPYMARVSHLDSPKDLDTQKVYWFYSPEEIRDSSAVMETFWDHSGVLVGIGLVMRTSQRILGVDSVKSGYSKAAVRINSAGWMSAIYLHLGPGKDSENQDELFIVGVSIVFPSGPKYQIGNTATSFGVRPLVVSNEHSLIGLEAQLNSDGTILRLGILECPKEREDSAQPEVSSENIGKRLLWAPSYLVPTAGASYSMSAPVWSHPPLGLLPLSPRPLINPEDNLYPYHILLWAKDIKELKKISRISILVASPGSAGTASDLLGLRAEYVMKYWEPKRYAGRGEDTWSGGQVCDFDLDGTGGEVITEIGVPSSGKLAGIMFGTNKGRRQEFGGPVDEGWVVEKVPEGRCIVGIAASFLSTGELKVNGPLDSIIMLHLPTLAS